MVNFGQPKSDRLGPFAKADSVLMHHEFRLSLLQWNPGPTRRNPSNIVSAACDRFHAVILQEASDHVPHISDYFGAYTDNMDLAILLNKDFFESDPSVLTFKADSTSKKTWGMVLLIVRVLLRRPSLSGTPTVTFCSVHIHNMGGQKRDASTELLQFLHAKMLEHNVEFIGGDFNMSVFSTIRDVFSDPEFSVPGHSCLWGLDALDEQHRECTGFLIMSKRPYEWRVDSHDCYKFDNAALGLGPRDQSAHHPVFLHLRNFNLPGPSSIMRSEQAQQRRYDRKHNKTERAKKRRPWSRTWPPRCTWWLSVFRGLLSVSFLHLWGKILWPSGTRCLLSPNVRSCWSYDVKTTPRRRTLLWWKSARVDLTHRKWSHIASYDTRELQSGPLQILATETTCLDTTRCLSGPSPHLDHSKGE